MKQLGTRYQFVYRDIVTSIYIGKYKVNDTLPTLSELCELYDVGRNTVRTALQMLETNGYINLAPRKQPIVCFDFENTKYKSAYLSEIARRRIAIHDVYDAMTMIMPDIFTSIVATATRSERLSLSDLVEQCYTWISGQTEQELSDRLCYIYEKAIKLSHNDLLRQIFISMYHFTQTPVSVSDRQNFRFKAMFPFVQTILRKFQKQIIEEDYNALKNQIVFFCQIVQNRLDSHFKRACKGISGEPRTEFRWQPNGAHSTSYFALASEIISDIRNGTYKTNDILPSYAQLALNADVSEKTSRNAIAILNRLRIVSTINGVGTQVCAYSKRSTAIWIKDETFRPSLIAFFESLHILSIISRAVIAECIKNMDDSELNQFISNMENKSPILSITYMFNVIFKNSKSPVICDIYEQLKCYLVWGYLFEFLWVKDTEDNLNIIKSIINLFYDRKTSALSENICFICNKAFERTMSFVEKQGVIIDIVF